MTELKCPKCGDTVVVQDKVREVFCTYCGTKFSVPEPVQSEAETLAFLKNAFAVGEYAEVIGAAQGEEQSPILCAYLAAAQLMSTYERYLSDAEDTYSKTAAKSGLLQLFTGRNGYSDHPMHSEFHETVKSYCAALAQQGGALASQPEYGELCGTVVEKLLRRKSAEEDRATYWSECALEQESIALLPFMPTQRLRALYMDYLERYQPHELLPNQQKTERAMRQELESRGENAPVRPGLIGRIRKKFGGANKG